MAEIFEYTDYRKYLKDTFAELKAANREFTYRYIAQELGLRSAGYLTQIIQGTSNLSKKLIQKIILFFELKKRESKYFELMVSYNQTESHDEKKNVYKKMIVFQKGKVQTLNPEEFEFYDHWYYSAIRAVLNYYPFDGDFEKLASMVIPRISISEARKAVAALEKMGFIFKNEDGSYSLTAKHITTGPAVDSVVINNVVLNTLDIAKDALYRFKKEERSFSALTLSVSDEGYQNIKNRIDDFRREIVEMVKADKNVGKVCQVNFQLFPLSVGGGGKE